MKKLLISLMLCVLSSHAATHHSIEYETKCFDNLEYILVTALAHTNGGREIISVSLVQVFDSTYPKSCKPARYHK